MERIIIYDNLGAFVGEIPPNDVFECRLLEQVNGEHSLTITTVRRLEQGARLLMQDGRGVWREFVVYGIDAEHGKSNHPYGTYYCVWSIQPELMGTRVSRMPGVQNPVLAAVALEAALSGTNRWTVGTVTQTTTGGASMYDTDGWDAISTLLDVWGGELEPTITVDSQGVLSRAVNLYSKLGNQDAKRRFDFGADIKSVRRLVDDGAVYCRITPRGKGEQTESGAFGRKITIASVNSGKDYLENPETVDVAKLPDGNGGYEYPTIEVENSDCETPAQLLEWARSVLEEYTEPRVTYEVDVYQAAKEGLDIQAVSLGDAVQVVDTGFYDGLRLSGRVLEIETDCLTEKPVRLVIGHLLPGLNSAINNLNTRIGTVETMVTDLGDTISTAGYISNLLDRINADINSTGGYTYITEGQGIRTYDVAVTDPLIGAEANSVVEIKGGTIRIANSKTAQGAWEWETVFTSGHIAANLVTAANITAGYIGSATSGNYWNLDTGSLRIANTATLGSETVADTLQDIADASSAASSANQTANAANQTANAANQTANSASQTANAASQAVTALDTSLNQQEVFNRLTNNGAADGLFLEDGNLYINARYLFSDELNAELLKLVDENGNEAFSIAVSPYTEHVVKLPSSVDIASGLVIDYKSTNRYISVLDIAPYSTESQTARISFDMAIWYSSGAGTTTREDTACNVSIELPGVKPTGGGTYSRYYGTAAHQKTYPVYLGGAGGVIMTVNYTIYAGVSIHYTNGVADEIALVLYASSTNSGYPPYEGRTDISPGTTRLTNIDIEYGIVQPSTVITVDGGLKTILDTSNFATAGLTERPLANGIFNIKDGGAIRIQNGLVTNVYDYSGYWTD